MTKQQANNLATLAMSDWRTLGIEACVKHLIRQNAVHTRKKYCLSKVPWLTVLYHMREEVTEFDDAVTLGLSNECVLAELGDILGVLTHAAIKAGFTLEQVEERAIQKLHERFTIPNQKEKPDEG